MEPKFTEGDLSTAITRALKTQYELLQEKGLIVNNEPKEPGKAKAFVAGLLHKGTKHITAMKEDILEEGTRVLTANAVKAAADKAKERRRKELEDQLKKYFPE